MAMNGVAPEAAAADSQVCSGGRRLISKGPFISSDYRIGTAWGTAFRGCPLYKNPTVVIVYYVWKESIPTLLEKRKT